MMSGQVTAEIGHWYQPMAGNSLFEVVAIDYDDQSIEIQYFDGDIEEVEFTGWKTLMPSEVAPPDGWSGAYDIDRQDPLFNEYAINEALISLNNQTPEHQVN